MKSTDEVSTESTSGDCQTDMSEQGAAKKLRANAKGKFYTRTISNLDQAMTAEAPVTTIESRYDTLRAVWKEVQDKHDAYVKLLPGDELDEQWIDELNRTFSKMEVKTDSYLEEYNTAKAQEMELKIRKETEEAEIRSRELAEIAKEEENQKARIKAKERIEELLARRDQEEIKIQTSIETIQNLIATTSGTTVSKATG